MSTGTAVRVPAVGFVGARRRDDHSSLEANFAANARRPASRCLPRVVRATPLVRELLDREARLEWTAAERRVRRPGQDARRDGAVRRAALPGAGAQDRPAAEDTGYRLAVLRPRPLRHGATGGLAKRGVRLRVSRTLSQHPTQVGALRLRETPPRPAPGGVLLYESSPPQREARRTGPVRFGLVLRPACQDACRRRPPHLRWLVQLRPALGSAQHRMGLVISNPCSRRV